MAALLPGALLGAAAAAGIAWLWGWRSAGTALRGLRTPEGYWRFGAEWGTGAAVAAMSSVPAPLAGIIAASIILRPASAAPPSGAWFLWAWIGGAALGIVASRVILAHFALRVDGAYHDDGTWARPNPARHVMRTALGLPPRVPVRVTGPLAALVADLCAAAGIPPLRAAVLDAPYTAGAWLRGRTVVVTWELRRHLPPSELRALLAHEVAHAARNGPRRWLGWAVALTAGVAAPSAAGALVGGWWLIAGIVLSGGVAAFGSRRLAEWGRWEEFAADEGAVRVVGDPKLVAAALRHGAALAMIPEDVPAGTHPPLSERIERLRCAAQEGGRSRR